MRGEAVEREVGEDFAALAIHRFVAVAVRLLFDIGGVVGVRASDRTIYVAVNSGSIALPFDRRAMGQLVFFDELLDGSLLFEILTQ